MRSVLLGVLVLAAVGSGCVGSSGPTTALEPAAPAATVTTAAATPEPVGPPPTRGDRYEWRAGDCFHFTTIHDLDLLPYAPYGADDAVPCEDFHTHEVFLATTVAEGAADPYPGDALSAQVAGACTAAFSDYVGVPVPDSWYEMIFYLPDGDEWAEGERYLACVVYRLATNGLVRELRGTVGGDPEQATWPVGEGDCLRGAAFDPRYGGPVPCSDEHTHQVIADLVFPGDSDDPYPGAATVAASGTELCEEAYAASRGHLATAGVVVNARLIGRADWEDGYRRLLCVAGVLSAGGDLLEGRGSLLDGEWEPAGVYEGESSLTA